MANLQSGTIQRDLATIFRGGELRAESDAALVERFLAERGEDRERAFAALVERHGGMVDRICRRTLGDGHEAQDACQAVFLVLARRAGAVRNRDSLACWLHGVALRVAARARARMRRTQAREQPRGGLAELEGSGQVAPGPINPDAELLHQEVDRLTARFRAPIVLCYLEGLTHDEAAARLNWPVGTVRSRLSRGRDQLRRRLVRRGLSPTGALGAMAAWAGLDAEAHAAGGFAARAVPALTPAAVTSMAHLACSFVERPSPLVNAFGDTSLSLTREVLRSMTLHGLAATGLALVPAGLIVCAGIVVGREREPGAGQGPQAAKNARPIPTTQPPFPQLDPDDIDLFLPRLLQAATDRYEAQRAYYEAGRITIDRLIDASTRLMEIERLVADTPEKKTRALGDQLERLVVIEQRERAEWERGKGTRADRAEVSAARLQAELELMMAKTPARIPTIESLSTRVEELERRLKALEGVAGPLKGDFRGNRR